MDLKCLDSKSAPLSQTAFMERTNSSLFSSLRRVGSVRFSHEFGSCRGSFLKISCSTTSKGAYLSNKTNNSSGQEKFVTDASLFHGNVRVLETFDDEYGGIIVDSNKLPINSDDFSASLHLSVSHWNLTGKQGIWLKLPLERSELVPIAVKQGFQYHHAEPGYVMLTYWLPQGPCMLPSNATHQVGVGAFVVNHNNEVLVVQEKFCNPLYDGQWKIPTGFIHESEEIYTGVVREVKEETGIDTEFIEVVAFRHAHNLAFDKSDLLFVCMLKPLSAQIIVDDLEVQAAKWMPLAEFAKQPLIEGDGMFKKIIDICISQLRKRYCGLSARRLPSMFDGRLSCLYYNAVDDPEENFQLH